MNFEQPNYLDQWSRVLRWYNRLSKIYSGIPHGRDSYYNKDEIHAFFESCYHLKDWLKNDGKSYLFFTGLKKNVSESMQICRDICNGDKHLVLDPKYKPFDKNTKFSRVDHHLIIGSPHIIKEKYYVNVKGKDIDVKVIADSCMSEWESFLRAKKLLK